MCVFASQTTNMCRYVIQQTEILCSQHINSPPQTKESWDPDQSYERVCSCLFGFAFSPFLLLLLSQKTRRSCFEKLWSGPSEEWAEPHPYSFQMCFSVKRMGEPLPLLLAPDLLKGVGAESLTHWNMMSAVILMQRRVGATKQFDTIKHNTAQHFTLHEWFRWDSTK